MNQIELDDSKIETADIDWNSIPEYDSDDASTHAPRIPEPSAHLKHWFLARDRLNQQTQTVIRGTAQKAIELFISHPILSAQPALHKFISSLARTIFLEYTAHTEAMDLLNCDLELAAMPRSKDDDDAPVPIFGIRGVDEEQEINRAATQELARRVFDDVYRESKSIPASMYLLMQESPAGNSDTPGQYCSFAKLVASAGDSRTFDLAACFEGAEKRLELGTLLWAYIVLNWETLRPERLVF
ncbi:hypothetical protein GGR58DRAFT_470882 [Xylaria digitata]|nr:hypothetical protein GGR58DRAFT_470882 [Xylaria digitata]